MTCSTCGIPWARARTPHHSSVPEGGKPPPRLLAYPCENPSALYRVPKPQNREKRVSESKKPPFLLTPERAFRVKKSPFLYRDPHAKWDFLTRNALFRGEGKWGFFDSETSFPDFGVLGPRTGRTPDGYAFGLPPDRKSTSASLPILIKLSEVFWSSPSSGGRAQ